MSEENILQNDDFASYTTAQLKGRRLRMARALTGYSRHDLCEKIGIATSTMDTWECGRVELMEKSSVRICTAFLKVGLCCSSEWLLSGKGEPPRLMDEIEKSAVLPNQNISDVNDNFSSPVRSIKRKIPVFPDETVGKELNFFLSLHKKGIFHVVERGGFTTRYKVGDCIAGESEKFENLIGKIIIGVLENEKTILCRLIACDGNECTVFLNSNNPQKKIILKNAAEIIWHRSMKSLTF